MATVRCDFYSDSAARINYAYKKQLPGDPSDGVNVMARREIAIAAFKATREVHKNRRSKAEVFEIWQSWHPDESKKLTRAQVNGMGKELAEAMFKDGHQVLIITHSNEPHLHNHILVNPVNYKTGKRLNDKLDLIPKLRQINDEICQRHGLSIPNREAKERSERTPEKVKQMQRFRGHSYILDTIEKGKFAAKYATNFDEYQTILGELGIGLRVGKKTLSYSYEGKGKAKRDRYMPSELRRGELEKTFQANAELFAKQPELRAQMAEGMKGIRKSRGESLKNVAEPPLLQAVRSHERALRNEKGLSHASDNALKNSILPIEEIRRAREGSIFEYCKKHKIGLATNEKGQTVLKGREYVTLTENEWINGKNKTRGSLIEFAAAYHRCSFVQAISRINGNPHLLLLEQHFGEQPRSYFSFYVPREQRMDRPAALGKIGNLLQSFGAKKEYGRSLFDKERALVTKEGKIRFLPMGEPSGALEFSEGTDGGWDKKKQGTINSPFLSVKGNGKRGFVFLDPFSAMKRHGQDLFSTRNRSTGILVLLEPDEKHVDVFVAGDRSLKELVFIHSGSKRSHQAELDFFNNLKSRYARFGISAEITTHDKALVRGGPEMSR